MFFAFIFSDVGFGEWFVLLAVILVVVGPKRLPETARKFGNWYAKFRRAADGFKRQLLDMDTEFSRAVEEAERETERAFTVEEGGGEGQSPRTSGQQAYDSKNGDAGERQQAYDSKSGEAVKDNGAHQES